jgi:hypothetical protein
VNYLVLERLEVFCFPIYSFLKEPLKGQFRPKDLHQAVNEMGYQV